jgi:Asp-tRNA(Asn)/Glu-tRNA(Gln) amidotransferase A subunit family amidase
MIDRRRFLEFFGAGGLAGSGLGEALWVRWQEEPESPVTVAMIAAAEEVAGLQFDPDEREMMRDGLARYQEAYAAIRALSIPNGVAPALTFEPNLPGVDAVIAEGEDHVRATLRGPSRVPGSEADVAFAGISELAHWLATGQISSTELTELYLRRLERYDPQLMFQVTATADRALRSAALADREIASGTSRGPLHGIPWGAKDLFAVEGYPTTWGAEPYRDQQLDGTATAVERLDAAGAVLVAKLTLGALAMGDVWFGGRTRNPWNPEQGSSGSSAGPGSATAAGCVGFALGTETRGSIVSPSTRNGVTGLRPTFGRVSRHGAMALSWSMDKIGPMCRSAEDCALVFAAIHGADGHDPTARTTPFRWDGSRDPRELRVGYLAAAFEADDDYSNREFDLETLRVLREDVGLTLHAVELPDFPVDALGFILSAEAAAAFDDLTRSGQDDELVRQGTGAWPNTFRTARMIPAVEYIQANRARAMYQVQLAAAFRDVDVVVAPSYRLGILGATNLTGQPCVVVPNGFRDDGTPVSISFLANLYADGDALQIAHAYQQATDFHLRRPPLD